MCNSFKKYLLIFVFIFFFNLFSNCDRINENQMSPDSSGIEQEEQIVDLNQQNNESVLSKEIPYNCTSLHEFRQSTDTVTSDWTFIEGTYCEKRTIRTYIITEEKFECCEEINEPPYQVCSDRWIEVDKELSKTITETRCWSEMAVYYNGTGIISGGTYDFDNTRVNSSSSVTFTIKNIGDNILNLTGNPIVKITSNPDNAFSVTQPGDSSLSPDESTSFNVIFSPVSYGEKSASIEIKNNDSDESTYRIILIGFGCDPRPCVPNTCVECSLNTCP